MKNKYIVVAIDENNERREICVCKTYKQAQEEIEYRVKKGLGNYEDYDIEII